MRFFSLPRRALLLFAAVVAASWGARRALTRPPPPPLRFAGAAVPYSSDPVEQDVRANSQAFTSIHAPLVSKSAKGRYLGVLARDWESSPDFRRWTFRFRGDVSFETGEPVTPRHLAESWRRLALVLERKGSRTGFLERLEGFAGRPRTAPLPGVAFDDTTLTLTFREPFPELLDNLAFQMYAAAHPSCYDPDGRWLCLRRAVSSGPYRVVSWDAAEMTLELRPGFPADLRHPRAASRVTLHADVAGGASDLTLGSSLEDRSASGLRFWGGTHSAISYLSCQSWSLPGSVCHDPRLRAALRDAVALELSRAGTRPTLSFFPLSVPGVKEAPMPGAERADILSAARGRRLAYRPSWDYLSAAQEAVRAVAARHGMAYSAEATPLEDFLKERAPGLPRYRSDVAVASTVLAIDDPAFSVRFMFRAKEGIRLPDPTGRIARELDRPKVDMQRVNELLWDDAIVWPFVHYSFGVWARPSLDLSEVNLNDASLALQWVGDGG